MTVPRISTPVARFFAAAVLAASATALMLLATGTPGASAAQDATCEAGTLPAGSYATVTVLGSCALDAGHLIEGDLRITGGTPTIEGARIDGDLLVVSVDWVVVSSVTVGGNVVAQNGFSFALHDSEVAGDVLGEQSWFSYISISDSAIDGSVRLDETAADGVSVTDSVITEDLVIARNAGNLVVEGNVVGGDLRLTENTWYESTSHVRANVVAGSLHVERDAARLMDWTPPEFTPEVILAGNAILRNVEVVGSEGYQVTGNRMLGTLLCRDNERFVAHHNFALSRLGQCAR